MRTASERKRHRESRVGDFFGSVVGDVANGDAFLASGGEIDAIVADSGADDDFAGLEALNAGPGEFEIVVDHDRSGVLDLTGEIRLAHGIECDDIGVTVEDTPLMVEWFGDEIGDDDFGQLAHGGAGAEKPRTVNRSKQEKRIRFSSRGGVRVSPDGFCGKERRSPRS
jgi:hypothetical protein